jgi:hypothetical protein
MSKARVPVPAQRRTIPMYVSSRSSRLCVRRGLAQRPESGCRQDDTFADKLSKGRRQSGKPIRPDLAWPVQQTTAHAQRIDHDGQGPMHRATGREEARVNDVGVVHTVGLAVALRAEVLGSRPKRIVPF